MLYDFWWVSSTPLCSSRAYIFGRKLDSDLYAHVKASGRSQGMSHEPMQNRMHRVHMDSCNSATASAVPQHVQSKTSYRASASCDPHVEDSLSNSTSSLSSSGKAVAQRYAQSAARQSLCYGPSDSLNYRYAVDPQLPGTMPYADEKFPVVLLHHVHRGDIPHEQEPSSNNFNVLESPTQCLWNDSQGQCSFTADTVTTVMKHISSHHLREHQHSDCQVRCRCRGCLLRRTIRRDTILRHIREIHYGDKFRRKHSP
ncbi:uncharacterized protein F5147DRAFT_693331 [Suillus discolor]|uniref:C2H2-type domain-containing protein n=1 Tax=Suillus discolor TaxID=1912936 RepID=A0A9P7JUR0_9AGAM|nr:uncharacterized protein F5147DRAFT_693331 [Suillus discolor]KAG2108930.1 hypothetical protein F5147DRAFT_693331 [Suillus discolor]